MNKRKTTIVYTPAPAPAPALTTATASNTFGRKAITDTNLVETLQWLLQYDQEQEKNFGVFDVI